MPSTEWIYDTFKRRKERAERDGKIYILTVLHSFSFSSLIQQPHNVVAGVSTWMKAKKSVESFSCQPESVSQQSHRFWQFEETKSFHSRLKICQNLSDVINRSDRLKLCLCVVAVSIGYGSSVQISCRDMAMSRVSRTVKLSFKGNFKIINHASTKESRRSRKKINWVFMSLSMSFRFDCADQSSTIFQPFCRWFIARSLQLSARLHSAIAGAFRKITNNWMFCVCI